MLVPVLEDFMIEMISQYQLCMMLREIKLIGR